MERGDGANGASEPTTEATDTNEGAASSSPSQSASEPVKTRVPVKPTFSKWFTCFGLFVGVLCLIDFLAVLRFINWGVWGRVLSVTDLLLGLIILPAWLLWLGSQLP